MYSLGDNDRGQLGLKKPNTTNKPLLINSIHKSGDRIDEISCGYKHVIARNYRGDVLTWGDNTLL